MAQDALSDGFVRLCIDPSLNFYGEGCKVLVEGQVTSDATAALNEVTCVTSLTGVEERFGQGSILTESLRKVFCQAPNRISVYALPRADAVAAVAAVYTLTVAGPATSDGRVQLFMGDGDYSIDIGIDEGDTAADIATLIAAEVSPDFPYIATAAADVVTFTARNAGTIGNHLSVIYSNLGSCNSITPEGVDLTFAQTVQGSVNPLPVDYGTVINECCFAVYILSSDDTDWQESMRDHIRSAWDCDKPQCFGHGYVFNRGTLGQILADGDNSAELSRLAIPVSYPVFPWLTNAAYAALSASSTCENPELSVQGSQYGLLSCITMPESCTPGFDYKQVRQLQDNGFVVSGPQTTSGQGNFTSPYIYNDVTNYLRDDKNRPNATYRDTSSRRLATTTAIWLAETLNQFNGLGVFTKNTNIRSGVMGTNPRLMLGKIRKEILDQVGVLFSEFDNINEDLQLKTDFEVQPKCVGKPGVFHLNMRYRPPVRAAVFNVNMQPALFENCDR